ncbi:MAG: DUF4296 domain-containing protein [Ignavibacteriaceae bacterium]|nr:DUF4296 domain-containing protein [Ignavibacteriaceae bacterium]
MNLLPLKNLLPHSVKMFSLLAVLFLLNGCEKKNVIPEEKFVEIYVDFLMAQDSLGNSPQVSSEILRKLREKHNFTEETYKNTYDDLSDNPENFERFLDKCIAELQKRKEEITGIKPEGSN